MNVSNFLSSSSRIEYSDFGRPLFYAAGNYVRFYLAIESPVVSKVILASSIILEVGSLIIPPILAISAAKFAIVSSSNLLVKMGCVAVISLVTLKIIKDNLLWKIKILEEYVVQKQEKQLVDILGGKAFYASLPRLACVEDVFNDIKQNGLGGNPNTFKPTSNAPIFHLPIEYCSNKVKYCKKFLNGLAPHHVGLNPITVDVDFRNRPFVSVCVKEKNNPAIVFVDTLFLSCVSTPPSWRRAGHAQAVFRDWVSIEEVMRNFEENMDILKQLQEGTHPTFELV
jgi:hypothetical protein